MHIHARVTLVSMASLLVAQGAGGQAAAQTKICLIPTTVEASSSATAAADATRDAFAGFLTGPSLTAQALQARLTSQAREEARAAGCPFILLTTIKHQTRRSGGGILGHVAAGAVRQGVAEAGMGSSAAGRIAGNAASTGASHASSAYASQVRSKDEVTLGWRLEAADGRVLGEEKAKRTAGSDGEDLLSPLVQEAAEKIVLAARGKP